MLRDIVMVDVERLTLSPSLAFTDSLDPLSSIRYSPGSNKNHSEIF